MKVKELIEILQEMDEEALVVTSSQSCTWGGYEEIEKAESKFLIYSEHLYRVERDLDDKPKKSPVATVIISSKGK